MAYAPENTIESFKMALDLGATGIESDVRLTADAIPVLVHDRTVGSVLRRRAIAKLTSSDLPEQVPTVEDLYRLVGEDVPVSLNLKDGAAFQPTIDVVRRFGPGAEPNLWLCHPDIDALTAWRSQTTAKLINSIRSASISNGLERRAAELAQRGLDGLNLFHSEWAGGSVTMLHRFGLLALGWGTEHSREMAELVDAGIDAVYSDYVDRMMAVIHEYYGAPS